MCRESVVFDEVKVYVDSVTQGATVMSKLNTSSISTDLQRQVSVVPVHIRVHAFPSTLTDCSSRTFITCTTVSLCTFQSTSPHRDTRYRSFDLLLKGEGPRRRRTNTEARRLGNCKGSGAAPWHGGQRCFNVSERQKRCSGVSGGN